MSALHYLHIPTPIGTLEIVGDAEAITEINFEEGLHEQTQGSVSAAVKEAAKQLEEYFADKRTTFSIPFKLDGTDFQKRIWHLVYDIPFGKTVTYLDLSVKSGDKNLMRAVGGANGANRLPILVPCHRVVGTNGKLTGYAGGLWRKEWLLRFESKNTTPELFGMNTELSTGEKV